jgi:hypothetical protein
VFSDEDPGLPPQARIVQYRLDDVDFVNEADDFHVMATPRTTKRVYFPGQRRMLHLLQLFRQFHTRRADDAVLTLPVFAGRVFRRRMIQTVALVVAFAPLEQAFLAPALDSGFSNAQSGGHLLHGVRS